MKKYQNKYWIVGLLLIFIVFLPSINNGITNWDDNIYISSNQLIKSFSFANIKSIFTDFFYGNYHPLTLLSYTFDYKFFKGSLMSLHFHNLILHLINSLLVYFLIKKLFKNNVIALFVMILFGNHPMHVESVAWISERKDVLYTMFYLISLLAYIKYIETKYLRYYILSIIIFILSLLSKGQAVTLSLSLLLIHFYFEKKINLKNILLVSPFFILSIIFGIIAIIAQQSSNAIFDSYSNSYFDRIVYASYGFSQYIIKGVLPQNLSAIYPYPKEINFIYMIYLLIIPLTIFALFKTYQKNRLVFFGLLFFIINIFPVLQLLPVGNSIMADRYFYIPSIGIFIILAFFFNRYIVSKFKNIALIISSIYLLILSFNTYSRTKVWKDSISLWNDVIKKQETSEVAWFNRGSEKNNFKNYTGALNDLNKAIELNPNYYDALKSRGMVNNNLGNYSQAIVDLKHCLTLNQNDAYSNLTIGISYSNLNDNNHALIYFDKAISSDNNYVEAYSGRGIIYAKLGEYVKAMSDFNTALKLNPLHSDTYSNRGILNAQLNKNNEAIADFNKAIEINPNFEGAYINKAMILIQLGNKIEACNNFQMALKLGSNNANQLINTYCK